ncbi:unnamed protein product [Boreogadus saida]
MCSCALGKAEYKAALLSVLIKQQILSLPTSQVLPEDDVPLFGGAGDGGEADGKHGKVGLDPRGGAISRTGGTVKLGGPVVLWRTLIAIGRAQGLKKKDLELGDSVFGEALAEDVWPSSGEWCDSTKKCVHEKLVIPEFADVPLPLTRQALIAAQQSDSSLASCFAAVSSDASVSGLQQSFLMEEGVLMRTWVARPGTPTPPCRVSCRPSGDNS